MQDTAAGPATQANPHEEPVETVYLGFVKIKIHRQTATQAALMAQLEHRRNRAGTAPAQPGSVSTAQVNRPPRTREEYVAHWNAWTQAGGTADENRTEAVYIMTEWLNRNGTNRITAWLNRNAPPASLDLSGLGLTSLPEHLPNMQGLDVGNNKLTSLPDMPNLVGLSAGGNQLTSLPDMPNMESLWTSDNQLTSYPGNITMLSCLSPRTTFYLMNNPLPQQVIDSLYLTVNAPDYQGPRFVFSMVSFAPARVGEPGALRQPPGPGELQLRDLEDIALENIAAFLPPNDMLAMSSADEALSSALEPQLKELKAKTDVSKATSLAELQASMELISELRSDQRPKLLHEAMLRLHKLPHGERQDAFTMVREIDPLTPEPPELDIILRYPDGCAASHAGRNQRVEIAFAQDPEFRVTAALCVHENAQEVAQLFGKTSLSEIYALEDKLIRLGVPARAMEAGGNVQEVAQEYGITTRKGIHHLESLTILSRSPNTAGGEMAAGGDLQAVAQKYGITTPDRIRALADRGIRVDV